MEDSKGCVSYAKSSMTKKRSKHINVKMRFVCDAIRDGLIVMQWCSTRDMIAAILTKLS